MVLCSSRHLAWIWFFSSRYLFNYNNIGRYIPCACNDRNDKLVVPKARNSFLLISRRLRAHPYILMGKEHQATLIPREMRYEMLQQSCSKHDYIPRLKINSNS